ncbi:Xaa-Pro dipeptidyl-peptidase [Mangrovihabitans endophyticus]|uniref:Xaa-Pro dipeptidyl-peptidase n=1 Tax=Mangrovihabitans endophyticus TaxID=1751298 RepID=A0A8J3BU62_9ACTN|nr:Xaa-Pro dipeptidyl-peptidase [Mangrovihabitans endophyticus]GGK78122.1 Xaa-Pro dipeptidyl-peptidase [Mangrovihabitans endophyticus]
MPLRRAALAVASSAILLLTASPAAAAEPPTSTQPPGPTQPVYDYAAAIRERVWVQAPVDSDGDGRRDRVAVRIIRPRDPGRRVPVIFQPSPYYAGLNNVPNHDDIDRGGTARRSAPPGSDRAETVTFSGYLDNYFVPRGYAVVFADSLGTGGSQGCPTSGGRNETLGMTAVIDWLNGRAKGWDADGEPTTADWSTGKTGMIGVSYNGTLPNAVAATGVEGLETIVPIAAISSWYDYYRANGGVVAPGGYQGEDTDILAKAVLTRADPHVCDAVIAGLEAAQDRETGDYSRYWAERDYTRDVDKVKASVLLVHGLHDENVRTGQAGQWWDLLAARDVPRKIWLHQAGHADPFSIRRFAWLDTLHAWFDHWLYGVDNDIMRQPMADIEVAPDTWRTAPTWPIPGARTTTWYPAQDGELSAVPERSRRVSFVDDPQRTDVQLISAPGEQDPNRLAFRTAPLTADTRISGTPEITVRADMDGDSPYLTALLVDYGAATRYAGREQLPGQDCIGPGIPEDPGCFNRSGYVTATSDQEIVSRGYVDVRNRHGRNRTEPITPGETYTVKWDLQTTDFTFARGHRIGLVIISTERDRTLRYPAGTEVGIRLGVSRIDLPLARS